MAFDNRNPQHMLALAHELLGDPVTPTPADPMGIGYEPALSQGGYQPTEEKISTTRYYSVDTIDVAVISPSEFQCGVDADEWHALAQREFDMWGDLLKLETLVVRDPNLRAQVLKIWPGGSTTRTNLAAMQTKTGSRAEELWGDGSYCTARDIQEAAALHAATYG